MFGWLKNLFKKSVEYDVYAWRFISKDDISRGRLNPNLPYPKNIRWFDKDWTYRGFWEYENGDLHLTWYGGTDSQGKTIEYMCMFFENNKGKAFWYGPDDTYVEEPIQLEDLKIYSL